uniref:Tc1-like transposase DDE domain-containing protein n=1 Tax=Strongyloides stercoralis TaxID=6248 RepID=A0AAF5I295_STRER
METGSVNDRKHARRRTVTHEENSLMITKQVEENRGQVSTRQLALDNNMSRSSVMKVLDEGGKTIGPGPSRNPTHSWHNPFIHRRLGYISEVVDVFVDELKTDNEDLQYIVFQQDGTSCHTSFETMPHPKSVFSPSNLISQNLDFGWPLRSPDLNPLDFYFWGRLRDLVFKNQPNSIEILKNRITAAIREVKRDELERVYLNFLTRLERCVKVEDGYFE